MFRKITKLKKLMETFVRGFVRQRRLASYLKSDRQPWRIGYSEYKAQYLGEVISNNEFMEIFRKNNPMPDGYGLYLDERVIEYPWILSKLGIADRLLLDAGSGLNHKFILNHPSLENRSIVIYNLSLESVIPRGNVSYIYGDLRTTILRDKSFDEIVCISTLEHIGMNNALIYSEDPDYNEFRPNDYQDAIREFNRLLKQGGRLFITVPYGRYENHGWLQQFDRKMVENMLDVFDGSSSNLTYYKYSANGWQLVDADACADCSYFDIHKRSDYEPNYVAAARAVALIEAVK